MNFGKKIAILYLGFVALILTLVILSYGQKVELVSKDYYAQELKYQDKLDAINNTNALANSIEHKMEGSSILLYINPDMMTEDLSGTINFFRPSDSSKDVKLNMHFINNQQVINTKSLTHGTYKMQLSWKCKGKDYFKEEVIFID
jgi:nitrogen fixation protein FixH